MENNKTKKRRVIAIDFSVDKERALRILEDEKKARETVRKRAKLSIKTKIPKEIDKIFKEADVA